MDDILIEIGEFVQYKGSKQIRWIESIDRHNKMITLGRMDYKDERYIKTFIYLTWEEFYKKFEDVKKGEKEND